MPKKLFCAECGFELLLFRKAVSGTIYDLVEPHTCTESIAEPEPGEPFKPIEKKSKPVDLNTIFDSFKFVNKLNDLDKTPDIKPRDVGDKRPPEHRRKELQTSNAPQGILNAVASQPNSKPAADISEEPSDG